MACTHFFALGPTLVLYNKKDAYILSLSIAIQTCQIPQPITGSDSITVHISYLSAHCMVSYLTCKNPRHTMSAARHLNFFFYFWCVQNNTKKANSMIFDMTLITIDSKITLTVSSLLAAGLFARPSTPPPLQLACLYWRERERERESLGFMVYGWGFCKALSPSN